MYIRDALRHQLDLVLQPFGHYPEVPLDFFHLLIVHSVHLSDSHAGCLLGSLGPRALLKTSLDHALCRLKDPLRPLLSRAGILKRVLFHGNKSKQHIEPV